MKKLYLLLFLFLTPNLAFTEDILYCSAEKSVGFSPKQNYKITNFKEERFKIKVDFVQNKIESTKLLFISALPDSQSCLKRNDKVHGNFLACTNQYGKTFTINETTLNYRVAHVSNDINQTDDLSLEYGKCERF